MPLTIGSMAGATLVALLGFVAGVVAEQHSSHDFSKQQQNDSKSSSAPQPAAYMGRQKQLELEASAHQRLLDITAARGPQQQQWHTDAGSQQPAPQQGIYTGEGFTSPVKVLLVTALLGDPCQTYSGNWVNVVSLRNKRDFAEMHKYGFWWTTEHLDDELYGPLNKLAILRQLAYQYADSKEVEWFWWLDQDTLFANITARVPWGRYGNADMVLWTPWGKEKMLEKFDAEALNSGVVLFRNTDWTRAFLDLMCQYARGNWFPHSRVRPQIEQELREHIDNFFPALYEQNVIAYLFAKHAQLLQHVFFEDTWSWICGQQPGFHTHFKWDYTLEVIRSNSSHQPPMPLIVHYAGCQFCGLALNPVWAVECMQHFLLMHAASRKSAAAALGLQVHDLNTTRIYHQLAARDEMLLTPEDINDKAHLVGAQAEVTGVQAEVTGAQAPQQHHTADASNKSKHVDRRQLVHERWPDARELRGFPPQGTTIWYQ